ncbi:MAG: trypsin-like peptidase domain-containing protein [Betaproteobacteria bacterium]|nr:trypsin-like peptidase domain-containing protein [Betaproteobacteria bacterium]
MVTNAHASRSRTDTTATNGGAGESRGNSADGRRPRWSASTATDLALLRLEGPPCRRWRSPRPAAPEGMDVALIGYPIGGVLGYSPVTHRGIVASITTVALPSLTARQLDAKTAARLREGPFEVYQLDATAYPGNSGGPVLDARTGEVVGVVNMVLVRGTRESALSNPTGISYAIPVAFVRELLQRPR